MHRLNYTITLQQGLLVLESSLVTLVNSLDSRMSIKCCVPSLTFSGRCTLCTPARLVPRVLYLLCNPAIRPRLEMRLLYSAMAVLISEKRYMALTMICACYFSRASSFELRWRSHNEVYRSGRNCLREWAREQGGKGPRGKGKGKGKGMCVG